MKYDSVFISLSYPLTTHVLDHLNPSLFGDEHTDSYNVLITL
jgi:hypothetical protein